MSGILSERLYQGPSNITRHKVAFFACLEVGFLCGSSEVSFWVENDSFWVAHGGETEGKNSNIKIGVAIAIDLISCSRSPPCTCEIDFSKMKSCQL